MQPIVSIGMPTRNRPESLARAIRSLTSQTVRELEILISDNSSDNHDVELVARRIAEDDPRIRYVRQPTNIGAPANFRFTFATTTAPYFMWASDDDTWEPTFVERALGALQGSPSASAWFCTIDNINLNGKKTRDYIPFSRFSSTRHKWLDLIKFVREPEILGKANLIYSVFRRSALADALRACNFERESWGIDIALVYALLTRHAVIVVDDVLMHKCIRTHCDDPEQYDTRDHPVPASVIDEYVQEIERSARSTKYWLLTRAMCAVQRLTWRRHARRRGR